MSHIPTLEERIALVESIVFAHSDAAEARDDCEVSECVHYCACDEVEAVGDQGEPLDAEIDTTISHALESLREILDDGDTEEILQATDQILAFLITDATE